MLVYQRVPTMLYWTHRFFMFPPAWSVVVAPTTVLQRLSSSPRTNPRFVALRIFLRDTLQQLQTKLRPIAFSNNKHVPFQNSKDPMWGKNSEANTPTTRGLIPLQTSHCGCQCHWHPARPWRNCEVESVSDLMKGHNWTICFDGICKNTKRFKQLLKQTETSILQRGILSFQPISVNRPLSMFLSQSWRCVTPNTQWCR